MARQLLSANPEDSSAWHLMGLLARDSGNAQNAIQGLEKATLLPEPQPVYFKDLADTYAALGRIDSAANAYRSALNISDDYFEVHANLGNLLLDTEKTNEALIHYRKAVTLRPDIAELHDNLGNALRISDNPAEAAQCHEKALQLKPQLYSAMVNKGLALIELDQLGDALTILEEAVEHLPQSAEAHVALATTLRMLNRPTDSLSCIDKARQLQPDDMTITLAEFYTMLAFGNRAAAERILSTHKGLLGIDYNMTMAYAAYCETTDQRRTAVNYCQQLLTNIALKQRQRVAIHFQLGDLSDQLEQYSKAFEYYKTANDLNPSGYPRDDLKEKTDEIISTFSRENLRQMPRSSYDTDQPVFIVGTSRAGKSLTEQILASHPKISGINELKVTEKLISMVEERAGRRFPDAMIDISREILDEIAETYLAQVSTRAVTESRRIINTAPTNTEHLGFISLLFPNAYIIHLDRDPRDVCLESYFRNYKNEKWQRAGLLDHGFHYHQTYRLMAHWKNILDIPIHSIRYEELVQEPETTIRGLLEYLNVEWNEQCLDFYHPGKASINGLRVATEPLSKNSMGRWKNYAEQIKSLERELNDHGLL
ncbi:hypothetical protein BOW51_09580 [Solemya velesiana gill symbiont]|uniref:Sulfotransferase n=2 Tax=Solemya velesiana gill symbiont TaxID=1918948 RepID=A0A1T2KT92_9GAMM|nr:hypothetical protein BOW51_09580 [Solemya velesiana gill symbiont]